MKNKNQNKLKGKRILLVEDEESLAVGLEYNLSEEGYRVIWARDGREAMDYLNSYECDLIILDIMLPYRDGFEIAQKIRENSPQFPILILTARKGIQDRIKGLQIGADDYLTKPFHLEELLLRIKRMLKRKEWYEDTAAPAVYHFGNNEINFDNLTCQVGGNEIKLTQQEAMVLRFLIDNKGKIVSRQALLKNVWNIHSEVETRTVDNFIARLRKYFEPDPANPVYIKSIRSAGYIFDD